MLIGVDTGGTFTDVVVLSDSGIRSFKVASTPSDPSSAVLEAVSRCRVNGDAELVHGTTVGTNALLERRGALTGLITTRGFEDLLAIGRQARPDLYDLNVEKPPPLVFREHCFGVDERVDSAGVVVRILQDKEIERVVEGVVAAGCESVAICLLFSFANPEHERRLVDALARAGLPVSVSHVILPEYREYERASTTASNAYLVPTMSSYLSRLGGEVLDSGIARLRVMQSNGGSISWEAASQQPVRTILSGPAGGVVAACKLSELASLGDLVTFDMGGTSTDVALVTGGAFSTTTEAIVAGQPIAVPMIDIHTVGAGGGSIAYVDSGGALRVGPESAAADPGPACYGRSDRPTVTDANVVLGRLDALLGGEMELDASRSRDALERLADQMAQVAGRPLTAEEAALGVVRIASANMERALRVVSIERGYDPRAAALLSFGGAGGLHACELASALGMRRVIVPPLPGAFSALGLLLGDVVTDASRTVLRRTLTPSELMAEIDALEEECRARLRAEGIPADRIECSRSLSMRYRGQSFEIDVPADDSPAKKFHAAHLARFGHADERAELETVHVRVRAAGSSGTFDLPTVVRSNGSGAASSRKLFFESGGEVVSVYDREGLGVDSRIEGPAIVAEYGSTTLVPHGWSAKVDRLGCLLISK